MCPALSPHNLLSGDLSARRFPFPSYLFISPEQAHKMFLEKISIDPEEEEKGIFRDRCSVPCRMRLDSGPTMNIGVDLLESLSTSSPAEGSNEDLSLDYPKIHLGNPSPREMQVWHTRQTKGQNSLGSGIRSTPMRKYVTWNLMGLHAIPHPISILDPQRDAKSQWNILALLRMVHALATGFADSPADRWQARKIDPILTSDDHLP